MWLWLAAAALLAAACSQGESASDGAVDALDSGREEALPADDGAVAADESAPADDGFAAEDGDEAGRDEAASDGGLQDGGDEAADAGGDDQPADSGDGGTLCSDWRQSLACCWLEVSCRRALVVSHGGDWNASDAPFLSRAAFEKAYQAGADGIELDVRVTADGVAVVAHSSPIEIYESLDCSGRKIEEMTAAEVTSCHLAPSFTQTFQRLDDVLSWAAGKLILELDVKRTEDLGVAMFTVLAGHAEERAFFLVSVGEIQSDIPKLPNWERHRYMVNISDPSQVDMVLPWCAGRRVFMFEMDRKYENLDQQGVAALIASKINPGGVKAFCASDKTYITVQTHLDMYRQGFDVVLSYSLANGIEAARQINAERGYPP